MLNSRGQASVEMLVLVSFLLLFSIPVISLVYLNATQSAQDSAVVQAREAARKIVGSADSVYVRGEGNSEKIIVVFPQNLESIRADGRELTLTVLASGGRSDVVMMAGEGIVLGSIRTGMGPHQLAVRSAGDYVEISEE